MLFANFVLTSASTAAEAAETAAEAFTANPMNFILNLKYMGMGMLGIFIVMGVIILVTTILNRITQKKEKDEEK